MKMKKALVIIAASLLSSQSVFSDCLSVYEQDNPDHLYSEGIVEGIVVDAETGLQWSRCPIGYDYNSATNNCDVTATDTYNWAAAHAEVVSYNLGGLGLGGFTNWRIANIKELQTLVAPSCRSNALNPAWFPVVGSGNLWTNTPDVRDGERAWVINSVNGQASSLRKSNALRFYLVR